MTNVLLFNLNYLNFKKIIVEKHYLFTIDKIETAPTKKLRDSSYRQRNWTFFTRRSIIFWLSENKWKVKPPTLFINICEYYFLCNK